MGKLIKKIGIVLFVIVLIVIIIFNVRADSFELGFSQGSNYKSVLTLTENKGFEKNIIYSIQELYDGTYVVKYYFNESLKEKIKDYKNKKSKEIKEIRKELKDIEYLNDSELQVYLDNFETFPVTNITSKVKVYNADYKKIDKINLSVNGTFIVSYEDFDKKNPIKSIGEKVKVGFKSTLFVYLGVSVLSPMNSPNSLIDYSGNSHVLFEISATSFIGGFYKGMWYCNNTFLWNYSCVNFKPDYTPADGEGLVSADIDSNNVIHVTSYDYGNGDLFYCNNTGGSWSCTNIITADDSGRYNAIAVDRYNNIHIVSTIDSRKNLSYCNNTVGGVWSCLNIINMGGSNVIKGLDVAVDSTNSSHIIYYNGTTAGKAWYCTNAYTKAWACNQIPTSAGSMDLGDYNSPSITVDNNDKPHAMYIHNSNYLYANNSSTIWSSQIIVGSGSQSGHSTISINKDGRIDSIIIEQYDFTGVLGIFLVDYKKHNNLRGASVWSPQILEDGQGSATYFGTYLTGTYAGSSRMYASKKGRVSDPYGNISQFSYFAYSRYKDWYYVNVSKFNNNYVNISLNNPLNNSFVNVSTAFNCSSASYINSLKNITYFLYNSTTLVNSTNITTSGLVQNSSTANMFFADGNYSWNCQVYNNDSLYAIGNANYTITIDTKYPSVNVSSLIPSSNYVVTFNPNISDTNLNNSLCFYTVYDSVGAVNNNLVNISFPCSGLQQFSVSTSGQFNLSINATDYVGQTTTFYKEFTVSASSSGGGGPPLSISSEGKIPVIGINMSNGSKVYSSLESEVIYAKINDRCLNRLKSTQPSAIADYSQVCTLYPLDFDSVLEVLGNLNIYATLTDIYKFYDSYKRQVLFQGYEYQGTVDKYGLFTSILGNVNILMLNPPSIDKTKSLVSGKEIVIEEIVYSNKPLKSCEVVERNTSFSCEVTNGTLRINYYSNESDYFTRIVSNTVRVTTLAPSSEVEQKNVPVVFRIYNWNYELISGMPVYALIIGVAVVLFVAGYISYVKLGKRRANKVRDIFSS